MKENPRLVDRLEVTSQRGVVHLTIGDMPDPFVLVMSPEHARRLILDIEDAAGVADLENEECRAELTEASGQSEGVSDGK